MAKKLIAYFSASGNTAEIANELSELIGADVYEITPEVPYSPDDLDFRNEKSRSFVETHDSASRPGIKSGDADIFGYDEIYLGFPVWWGIAPHIVNTFLDSQDFSGKRIVLFASSAKDGFGNIAQELKVSLPESAQLTEGVVFSQEDDTPRSKLLNELAGK